MNATTKSNGNGGSPIEAQIRDIFRRQYRTLAALFPEHGDTMVTRACSIACTISRTVKADPASIADTAVACLHLGLEIGDQAYAVPHGGRAGLIVGPRGLIALAYRSGFVKSIEARSVFRGDEFEYELGDKPFIRHRKATEGRRPPKNADVAKFVTHAYVVIETKTDGVIREVLTAEDLAFYRSFSKANNGPWFDNFEGMARKTAIKRGLEFVPRSPLLASALRETERGTYEIPDDVMAAALARAKGDEEQPGTAPAQPTDEERLVAIDAGRA
jgi:recombination protein RecT